MRRALIAMVAALGSACALIDPCDNDSFKEFKAPSGKWKVVVFQRSCGATTDFSTQVSVLSADSPLPKKAGNVLIIDSNHGEVAVDRNGLIDVGVSFASDAAVTLAYPARARVFVEASNIDGVQIRYSGGRTRCSTAITAELRRASPPDQRVLPGYHPRLARPGL